jgi:hypothetical protein
MRRSRRRGLAHGDAARLSLTLRNRLQIRRIRGLDERDRRRLLVGRAESRNGQRPDGDNADQGVMGGRGHGRARRGVRVGVAVEGVRLNATIDRIQRIMNSHLDHR